MYFSFSEGDDFVFCNISGWMAAVWVQNYDSNDWRLFIDSPKHTLKWVVFYNMTSTKVEEEYPTISLVMNKIKYMEHNWVICVDLKMVNLLLGQSGYTKHLIFICLWESWAVGKERLTFVGGFGGGGAKCDKCFTSVKRPYNITALANKIWTNKTVSNCF